MRYGYPSTKRFNVLTVNARRMSSKCVFLACVFSCTCWVMAAGEL